MAFASSPKPRGMRYGEARHMQHPYTSLRLHSSLFDSAEPMHSGTVNVELAGKLAPVFPG